MLTPGLVNNFRDCGREGCPRHRFGGYHGLSDLACRVFTPKWVIALTLNELSTTIVFSSGDQHNV